MRRGVDLLNVMLGFLVLFFLSELAIVLQWTGLNLPMWVIFGMTGQVAVLAYPWLSSHFGAGSVGARHHRDEPRAVPGSRSAPSTRSGRSSSFPDHPWRRLPSDGLPGRLRRFSRGTAPGAALVSARPVLADGRGATVERGRRGQRKATPTDTGFGGMLAGGRLGIATTGHARVFLQTSNRQGEQQGPWC